MENSMKIALDAAMVLAKDIQSLLED